jgi:phosphoribosylformylglycinamidine synthase PurS subunit
MGVGAVTGKSLVYCKSIINSMKAHVYVTLKRTVLDAQGQTVADALRRMNYRGVADVRQGKYFLLTLESPAAGADEGAATAEVDRIAREVLVNPVIEEYTFRLEAS